MRKNTTAISLVFLASLTLSCPVLAAEPLPPLSEYAGAKVCGGCHREMYENWEKTFHKNAVREVKENPDAIAARFEGPVEGFTRADVKYVVGGHWYQRYMVEIDGELYLLPRIWSVASQGWQVTDAWSWKKKPYSTQCKGCHATRYDPDAKVEVEHEVGCEACHGPGGRHARSGGKTPILDPAALSLDDRHMICASCHVRGKDATGRYPFAVGYVPGRDLTQYYRPLAEVEGETTRQTFLRTFREWYSRLGQGLPPGCDVCGIDRPRNRDHDTTSSQQCMQCHKFKDATAHGGHPGDIDLECQECHKASSSVASASEDIHSPDYYLVHKGGLTTRDSTRCGNCHSDR